MRIYICKKNLLKKLAFCVCSLTVSFSCTHLDVFEKTVAFPKAEWPSTQKDAFDFSITDTAARYNIYIVVRHTDAYHFNNLWVNLTSIAPGDTAITARSELKLGNNLKWLGSSYDDVIEHRLQINPYPVKFKQGNYRFYLQQVMREDPLQNIVNAGIRIEKIAQ